MLEKLVCPTCGTAEAMFTSLGRVAADKAWCPNCPGVRREVVTFYKIRGDELFLDRSLAAIGVPAFDIVIARSPRDGRSIGLELSWDAPIVLGPLSPGDADLQSHHPAAQPTTAAAVHAAEGLEWT